MINESFIFSKDNLYVNFDKFESGECNICLVTGLSGSGKSTMAKELCDKYRATLITLDNLNFCFKYSDNELVELISGGDVYLDFFKQNRKIQRKLINNELHGDDFSAYEAKFLYHSIGYCLKSKDRYIIEGVHIYNVIESGNGYGYDYIKYLPLIVLGTSMSKSIYRRFKRHISTGKIRNIKDDITDNVLSFYIDNEKRLKDFRKEVSEDGDNMSFETLNGNEEYLNEASLKKYKKIELNKETRNKYKLNKTTVGNEYKGSIFVDKDSDKVVGYINVKKDNTYAIDALYIDDKYSHKKLVAFELLGAIFKTAVMKNALDKKNGLMALIEKDKDLGGKYRSKIKSLINTIKEVSKDKIDSVKELNEFYIDFMMKPYDEQVILDEQSLLENGYTNRDWYNKLFDDISDRVYLDESVSTEFEVNYVNTIHNTSFIDKLNDLPYFTPIDMSELGVYSKADSNYYGEPSDNENNDLEWYQSYDVLQYGMVPENFVELNKRRVNKLIELSKNFNENKQTIIELGWNPEVPFTPDNRIKATYNTKERLYRSFPKNEFFDATKLVESCSEDIITEASVKDKNPVFITLVYTASLAGHIIRKYTNGIYTHAAISLESSLNKLYSYNLVNNFGALGGLAIESIDGYIKDCKDAIICVYVLFIDDEKKKKLKKKLDYYVNNVDKTRYSFLNILALPFNKPIELEHNMICSQFVDRMLKFIDIDITGMSSALVTPNDIYRNTADKVYKLYEGRLDMYNKRKVDRAIRKLSLSSITEKESSVRFDEEGNLLIIKDIKDIESEYNKSHKLLMIYDRDGNYDAMKPELCKLWYLNSKLEHMIFNTKNPPKEYYDTRSRILNDFNKYVAVVNKNDPSYVFTNDYDKSVYADNSYKISSHTLKHGIDYFKRLVRP